MREESLGSATGSGTREMSRHRFVRLVCFGGGLGLPGLDVSRLKVVLMLRTFASIAAAVSLLLGSPSLSWAEPPDSGGPPNVLLLLADDMTYTDLGCYGNADVKTPHLDRLASEGMRFTECFNSSPMCAPTRMSLYTGIHPVRNGAWPNHSRVHDWVRSLPHHLGRLDYRVALVGKRHERPRENFPFEFLGGRHHDGGKGTALPLEAAREFITDADAAPWCLVVANNQPHFPWNRGDASAYRPDQIEVPPYMVDTPETRRALTKYYAEISYMDAQVGRCLEFVEESGQREETLVLFLSEQGSQLPFGKWTCYEMGLRSAAIARWPGQVPAGSTSEAMIQYVDVVPTLLEAAGADPETMDFDGRSFLPVLRGDANEHQEIVFGLQTTVGVFGAKQPYGIRTARSDRYRMVWNLQPEHVFDISGWRNLRPLKSWHAAAESGDEAAQRRVDRMAHRPELELFDIRHDPECLRNLAAEPEHQAALKDLHGRLRQWMRSQGDAGAETELAGKERLAK